MTIVNHGVTGESMEAIYNALSNEHDLITYLLMH